MAKLGKLLSDIENKTATSDSDLFIVGTEGSDELRTVKHSDLLCQYVHAGQNTGISSVSIGATGKVELREDGEGGNIRIYAKSASSYSGYFCETDIYNDTQWRTYFWDIAQGKVVGHITANLTGSYNLQTMLTDIAAKAPLNGSNSAQCVYTNATSGNNTRYFVGVTATASGAKTLYNIPCANMYTVVGTTSTEGQNILNLGNSIASGTADNSTGKITLWNAKGTWFTLSPGTGTSGNVNYLPDSGGTLLNTSTYSSYALPLAGGTMKGDILFANSGTAIRQIRFQVGDNDYARIAAGATAANAGWMEIATADDATEPIYVRQYTGLYTTVKRTLTLLDASGNTTLPGYLTVAYNGARINGALYLGTAGSYSGSIELYGGNSTATPYIDFHYGASTADYTARLIVTSNSELYVTPKLKVAGTITAGARITGNGECYITAGSTPYFFCGTEIAVTKGSKPSTNVEYGMTFCDSTGNLTAPYRLMTCGGTVKTTGQIYAFIRSHNNVVNGTSAEIQVGFDASGNAYTYAPGPSSASDNSNKIATTSWCRNAWTTIMSAVTTTLTCTSSYTIQQQGCRKIGNVIYINIVFKFDSVTFTNGTQYTLFSMPSGYTFARNTACIVELLPTTGGSEYFTPNCWTSGSSVVFVSSATTTYGWGKAIVLYCV